jgi:hypothetical protein
LGALSALRAVGQLELLRPDLIARILALIEMMTHHSISAQTTKIHTPLRTRVYAYAELRNPGEGKKKPRLGDMALNFAHPTEPKSD